MKCFDEISNNWPKDLLSTYANIIEGRITFRIKIGYDLELLMPETWKQ